VFAALQRAVRSALDRKRSVSLSTHRNTPAAAPTVLGRRLACTMRRTLAGPEPTVSGDDTSPHRQQDLATWCRRSPMAWSSSITAFRSASSTNKLLEPFVLGGRQQPLLIRRRHIEPQLIAARRPRAELANPASSTETLSAQRAHHAVPSELPSVGNRAIQETLARSENRGDGAIEKGSAALRLSSRSSRCPDAEQRACLPTRVSEE